MDLEVHSFMLTGSATQEGLQQNQECSKRIMIFNQSNKMTHHPPILHRFWVHMFSVVVHRESSGEGGSKVAGRVRPSDRLADWRTIDTSVGARPRDPTWFTSTTRRECPCLRWWSATFEICITTGSTTSCSSTTTRRSASSASKPSSEIIVGYHDLNWFRH